MGFLREFVSMIKILFEDASACMKVSGSLLESFVIGRGIKQGCPIAPYLFWLTAEVHNTMVVEESLVGKVKGIKLPVEDRQQIVVQYVDNMSFTLRGEEESVRYLIYTLDTF